MSTSSPPPLTSLAPAAAAANDVTSNVTTTTDLSSPVSPSSSGVGGDDRKKHSLEAAFASILGPVASTGLPSGARLRDPDTCDDSDDNNQWACCTCTYLNHPLLKSCEQCSMPRFMVGTSDVATGRQRQHPSSPAAAATTTPSVNVHPDQACFCHPQDVVSVAAAGEAQAGETAAGVTSDSGLVSPSLQ